jgi:hypothetical protein
MTFICILAWFYVHIKNITISDLAYMNTVLVEEMGNVKDDIIKDFAETTKLNVKWKQNVLSIIMRKIWGLWIHLYTYYDSCVAITTN